MSLLEAGHVSSVGAIMSVWVLIGRFSLSGCGFFTWGGEGSGYLPEELFKGSSLFFTVASLRGNALGGVEA